jgi:tetratricopeptide (TPR) repeat protein
MNIKSILITAICLINTIILFADITVHAQNLADSESKYQSLKLPNLSILSYNIEKLCQEYKECNATRVVDLLRKKQHTYQLLTNEKKSKVQFILSKTMNNYWSIQVNQKNWFVIASDQHVVFELFEKAQHLADKKQFYQAEQQIQKALALKPDMGKAYMLWAYCNLQQNKLDKFIQYGEKAIQLEHANPEYYNHMAWFYATTKQRKFRNGRKALQYALKAVSIMPDNWEFTDTLAAAYACNAQFHEAFDTQNQSISLIRDSNLPADQIHHYLKKMNHRKSLYQHRKAYIDTY